MFFSKKKPDSASVPTPPQKPDVPSAPQAPVKPEPPQKPENDIPETPSAAEAEAEAVNTADASIPTENETEASAANVNVVPALFRPRQATQVDEAAQAVKQEQAKVGKENEEMNYEVVIGENTAINGNINVNGATKINGSIEGTLTVKTDLFVGETGHLKADIYTVNAEVGGTIIGNITCQGKLELLSTSKFEGDIKCSTLVVNEGAEIEGTIHCGKGKVKPQED